MRIQHNISSMNANRNLSQNRTSLGKNLEKLSSGYRINRSADDAAGLAVSEKMRAEISGLKQTENNIRDGISLVQTADGAMQEIQDMLNRVAALGAQAANGTNTDEEREHIQAEIDEILDEIVRIRETTEFNGIPLLQGNDATTGAPATVLGGLPDWVNVTVDSDGKHLSSGTLYSTTESWEIFEKQTSSTGSVTTVSTGITGTKTVEHAAAYLDFSNLDAANVSDLLRDNMGFYTTCCTCTNHYSIQFTTGKTTGAVTPTQSGDHYIYEIGIDGLEADAQANGTTMGGELIQRILTATGSNPKGHYTRMATQGTNKDTLIVYDERAYDLSGLNSSVLTDNAGVLDSSKTYLVSWTHGGSGVPRGNYGLFGAGVAYDSTLVSYGDVILQIGTTDEDSSRMKIDLPDMALDKIGVKNLSVLTTDKAQAAITAAKNGINYVSKERGRMGAYQNRLEHAYRTNSNTRENLTASESQIRDTDIAAEMMSYTKNNILIQSAQAMLSQANQTPQGVLRLMQ